VNEKQNRFYGSGGDLSTQLSPWQARAQGFDPAISIFRLERELRFRSDIAGGDLIVPVGFLSDLASIPRVAWSLGYDPDCNEMELASWHHDWLYSHVGKVPVRTLRPDTRPLTMMVSLTRKQCDQILCVEGMAELGAKRWQRNVVYILLRLFGRSSFNSAPSNVRWGPK
jgi:hypothetical protein